jgi:hypothetical protein
MGMGITGRVVVDGVVCGTSEIEGRDERSGLYGMI